MPNQQSLSLPIRTTSPSAGTFTGNTGFFAVNVDTNELQVVVTLTPPSNNPFSSGTPYIQVSAQDQLPGTRTYNCSVNLSDPQSYANNQASFTVTVKPPQSSVANLPTPMQVTITLSYGGAGGE